MHFTDFTGQEFLLSAEHLLLLLSPAQARGMAIFHFLN